MARRKIEMNEIVEIVYQWHQGNTIKGIKRSLGFDRKTIRKYINIARQLGVKRGEAFPEEQELIEGLGIKSRSVVRYQTPALKAIGLYRDQIRQWLKKEEHITARQIWRLLQEDYGVTVSRLQQCEAVLKKGV